MNNAIKKPETKEYNIPVTWVMTALIPVEATSLQDAANKVFKMRYDEIRDCASASNREIEEDLLQEVNPNVSNEEINKLDLESVPDQDDAEDDDSRDIYGDRNLEAQDPQD